MALRLFSRRRDRGASGRSDARRRPSGLDRYEPAAVESIADDLLLQSLQLKRFGLVLANRVRWKDHPGIDAATAEAGREFRERFSEVPDGFASLPQTVGDAPGSPEVDLEVAAYFLARNAVTNAEYQHFVDAGGYRELELWPRDLWPQLTEFRDSTGERAPRYWQAGRHDRRYGDHPVVGVCYYEAAAYARWAGYRLPSESEWQMAATWRLRSVAHMPRRYPWGNGLDTRRCNTWATGLGTTAPVAAFPEGAAPNGIGQLIGNVWEWTSSDYQVTNDMGWPVVGDMPMKGIRGGAFDTYFPAQATSTFRTGLAGLVRAHNVGFRCASTADLAS